MSHAEMQAGNSDIYNLIGLIGGNMFIPLQTADSETEAQLSSLPVGDVLVLVEGDFYYNGPEAYWLVIKEINQVNLPYTPETPLDATYTHNDPVFSFNYPSGWFVVPVENETEAILYLHNVPPTHDLRVGRERRDPTRFDFTISLREATSVETYVNERTTDELSSFCIEDVTTLNINGRSVTRIRFDKGCLGRTVEYIFSLNEQVFSISSNAQHAPFFIERVLATLR